MRYGFVAPHQDARQLAQVAGLGERAGWDGIFVAEAVFGVDAWVALGAAAMATERIRLGTLLTPVSRWKPWDLASRVGTVDRLSNGRAVMGAGLGALHDGWLAFEPDEGRKARAAKLDECLAIYAGLLEGQPFEFSGEYYSARPPDFDLPPPTVQRPRPPIWMVGAYVLGRDRQPSLDRAAGWDGLIPAVIGPEGRGKANELDEFAALLGEVRDRRASAGLSMDGYDVVLEADSTGEFMQRKPNHPGAWEEAGATWWVESWWTLEPGESGSAELRRRIAQGPPGS